MEFYVQKHISTKLLVRHLLKREKSVKRLKEKASDHHYFAHFFFLFSASNKEFLLILVVEKYHRNMPVFLGIYSID